MKIKFADVSYEIMGFDVNLDSNNIPVDISLYGDINTLLTIRDKHVLLGFNYNNLQEEEGLLYSECLCGRLEPFIIEYSDGSSVDYSCAKQVVSLNTVDTTVGFIYWILETTNARGLLDMNIIDMDKKIPELLEEYHRKYPSGLTGWSR